MTHIIVNEYTTFHTVQMKTYVDCKIYRQKIVLKKMVH